jgi:hypothetical protein
MPKASAESQPRIHPYHQPIEPRVIPCEVYANTKSHGNSVYKDRIQEVLEMKNRTNYKAEFGVQSLLVRICSSAELR